jgi:hypothetical protein
VGVALRATSRVAYAMKRALSGVPDAAREASVEQVGVGL